MYACNIMLRILRFVNEPGRGKISIIGGFQSGPLVTAIDRLLSLIIPWMRVSCKLLTAAFST